MFEAPEKEEQAVSQSALTRSEGGQFIFDVTLVCGDHTSALHNIDVCGCVFMHGTT